MSIRAAIGASRTREATARGLGRKERRALVPALLACLGWPSFSSTAEATPFQQYANGVCRPDIPSCAVNFAAVPAGKRLEIDNVSCYSRVNGDHALDVMYVYANEKIFFLAPEVLAERTGATASQTTIYAANHSMFAFANAGDHFGAGIFLTLGVTSNGVIGQFACHISGRLLDAPG